MAAVVTCRREQLLREHVAVELKAARIDKQMDRLPHMPWSAADKMSIAWYYRRLQEKCNNRISEILDEISSRAIALGEKPHTIMEKAYDPSRWTDGNYLKT